MDGDIISEKNNYEDAEMDEDIIGENAIEELQDIVSSCCNVTRPEGKLIAILNQMKILAENKCRHD